MKPNHLLISFLKYFLGGIVLSFFATVAILVLGSTYNVTVFVSVIADILYLVWMIYNLRNFLILVPDKKKYYFCNLVSMGIYAILATGFAFLIHCLRAGSSSFLSKLYTFLCLEQKSIYFYLYSTKFSIGKTVSSALFFAICMITIAIMPIFVNEKKLRKKYGIWYEEDEEE